ncbi:DMT family transporter [Photobacterium nomapromontoriensis]
MGLLGVAGFNLSLFIGLKTTTPINGALIMATTPITTALLSSLLDKEKLSINQPIGIVFSFVGVVFVISKGSIDNLANLHFSLGDCIILCGSLFGASYTVGCRKYITHSSPLQTTSFTMLFVTIGIVLAALLTGNLVDSITSAPVSVHMASIYMGVVGSVLDYLFWNVGLKKVGPANTSIFFNLVPVFTMVITAFNGVLPNEIQIIGTVSVIVGVILSTGGYKLILNQFKPLQTE